MGIETGYLLWGDRYGGPAVVRGQIEALRASGAIDLIMCTDQYGNFIPPSLWTPESSPLAGVMPDCDSLMDALALSAYALAVAPDVGVILSTDSNRRGPIEFAGAAMTLAELSGGRATVFMGSGEAKNTRPLGYKRQGLGKMEDILRVWRALWDDQGPLDFDGNHWRLQGATIGGQRGDRPRVWGMGEGPRLLDLATSYADGIVSAVPLKFPTAEDCRERIELARGMVAEKGRDPDEFGAGMQMLLLAHEDVNVIDRAVESPLVKWMTAISGRVGAENWAKAGLSSPVPEDWVYYRDYVPTRVSEPFVQETIAKVTREHVEASYIIGTPEQVAEQLMPYGEVGLSMMVLLNYVPLCVDPEAAAGAFAADMDICARVKSFDVATPR